MNSKLRLITFTVIGTVLLLVLFAEYSYIKTTEAEAEAALAEADTRSGNDDWTRSVRAVEVSERDTVLALDNAKLTKAKLVDFIELLEKTGKSMNLALSVTSVTSDAEAISSTTPETVRIAVTTSGSWSSSLNFVHLLETLPHNIYIENSELGKEGQIWKTSSTLRLTTLPEIKK